MLGTPPAVSLAWLSPGQGVVDSCLNSGRLTRLGLMVRALEAVPVLRKKMLKLAEKSGRVWGKGPGPVSFGPMAI